MSWNHSWSSGLQSLGQSHFSNFAIYSTPRLSQKLRSSPHLPLSFMAIPCYWHLQRVKTFTTMETAQLPTPSCTLFKGPNPVPGCHASTALYNPFNHWVSMAAEAASLPTDSPFLLQCQTSLGIFLWPLQSCNSHVNKTSYTCEALIQHQIQLPA